MSVGIEKLCLYPGRLFVDAIELAEARGRDPRQAREQVMVRERTVVPVFEDAITLGVNAARRLLTPEDRAQIELLVVATESAVDFGKAMSTWVHRHCELSPACRTIEVKNACYAGTGALKLAASWVAAAARPGKKALVISADFTRRATRDEYDFVGGGCAVAMLVSRSPRVLALELGKEGYFAGEIADAFRPTSRVETVDNEVSLFAYLDALEGAYDHYQQVAGAGHYDADFKKHIYHAPFPGMTLQAHRTMLSRLGVTDKAAIRSSFERKVKDALHFGARLGTAYGASTFISLLGHLQVAEDLQEGDPISFFAYGSGCQGEFYKGTLGPGARDEARALELEKAIEDRRRLSVEEYERIERVRDSFTDQPDYEVPRDTVPGVYEERYAGRGLLVLERVEGFRRSYGFS
ncbi:hydroxymethylglutaryl-CoA synthase family protein [Polyangium aurulentum]|uniref:hydroxymethylglutaryl-CoA synthase family protein n=1 Tax=Polyangium aurulentum TaxID=2567896 RepID=UPI0010ADA7D8|nr:hydroxymethylglutaryl-CoA synthase [Polyangium aurulentum]UQA57018.1 hydroxymethylglutaryl-CoA synthase family protein [Polyangium aurulentum]